MRLRLLMPLLLALVAPTQATFGYIAGKSQLDDVLDHSAAAVVGRIEGVGEGVPVERRRVGIYGEFSSPVAFRLRPAVVRVEVVLRGDGIAPGAAVPFKFLWYDAGKPAWIGLPEYKPGERWMLFLGAVEGSLEPINPLGFQDLRLPGDYRPPEPNYRLSLQRTEAVLADLLRLTPQQLATPQAEPGASLAEAILQTVLSGSLTAVVPRRSGGPSDPLTVYRPGLATGDLLSALFRVSNSEADPAIRATAAGILVRLGSSDAIGPLVSAERDLTRQGGGRDHAALGAIEQIRDPAYLPLLHELLSGSDAKFRAPAASALRGIADRSSIPYLVKALDDPSFDVRYFAATGLAAIANDNSRYLAIDAFKAQEAQQIAYWKAWYQRRQANRPPRPAAP